MTKEATLQYSKCVDFYLKVYERPTFLQRNMRKALFQYRKSSRRKDQVHKSSEMVSIDQKVAQSLDYFSLNQSWDPKDIINMLERSTFSHQDPVLQINITDMQDQTLKPRDQIHTEEKASAPPKTTTTLALCSLTIWDSSLKTLVEQTRTCNIYSSTINDQRRQARVELSTPFLVPLKLLKTRTKGSTACEITFSTQFVIMSANNTVTWPPLDMQIPEPKNPRVKDDGVSYVKAPLLLAKWTRLPYLPEKEADSLMEIKALQDEKTYKTKYTLKFDARWINADSPLKQYNKVIRPKSNNMSSARLLAPGMSKTKVRTQWIFQGVVDFMDKYICAGYICPLCHNKRFREPTEYHFHLRNSHDRFNFEYSVRFETNEFGQSLCFGTVLVQVEGSYLTHVERESRKLTWIRPKHPFDLEAYLNGDDTWINGDSEPVTNLDVPDSRTERSSSRENIRNMPKKIRKRAIEDISEIVITKKRKFKVPVAPKGFSYYRTVSKVPLVEGDELSESDDDINEEWLLEKHADTIDSFTDTLPSEKTFIQRFDRHMLLEDSCSNLHSEEALIRFCKQNNTWLWQQDMKFEFAKKTAALKINNLISNDILIACWKIINDTSIGAQPQEVPMEIDGNEDNEHKIHKIDKLEYEHIYGRCGKCHNGIYDKRELLYCANGQCPKKSFHIHCGDQATSRRPKQWNCTVCMKDQPKATSSPLLNGTHHTPKTTKQTNPITETTNHQKQRNKPSPSHPPITLHLRATPSKVETPTIRIPLSPTIPPPSKLSTPPKIKLRLRPPAAPENTLPITPRTLSYKSIVIESDGENWSEDGNECDEEDEDEDEEEDDGEELDTEDLGPSESEDESYIESEDDYDCTHSGERDVGIEEDE